MTPLRQLGHPTPLRPTFCVIGAGHGGQAMAAHLALSGFEVRLHNRSPERLAPIRHCGGIQLSAAGEDAPAEGFGRIECATSDLVEALHGVDVVMVVVPASDHAEVARDCAPRVTPDQMVVLNPGRTLGALEFHNVLRGEGLRRPPLIAEAQTLLYATRMTNPGQVRILRVKNSVPVAALKAFRTPEAVRRLRVAFPQFVPADSVLATSLSNIGAVFHPAMVMMNAGRIGRGEAFQFYTEGITPSVAEVLESLDSERVAVAEAVGCHAPTAREWLHLAYDAVGRSLFEALRANPGYRDIPAPVTLNNRYLNEDVPFSLVPLASLGEWLNVPTPTTNAMVQLAISLTGRDFWKEGRTVDTLGLAGRSVRDLRHLVFEGCFPADLGVAGPTTLPPVAAAMN